MCRTDRMTSLLREEAGLSDLAQKHASCIVRGGKVLSLAHNSHRTYFAGEVQASLHAEMAAILGASTSNTSPRGPFAHSAPARQAASTSPAPTPATVRRTGSPKGKPANLPPLHRRGGADSSEEESDVTEDSLVEILYNLRATLTSKKATSRAAGRRPKNSPTKSTQGADLYVCRMSRTGGLAESRPCFRCASWIFEAGIKRVFYTARSPVTGLVGWTSQTVPSLLEEMLEGRFFATAMDRNFFAGREKVQRKVIGIGTGKGKGEGKEVVEGEDVARRKKARWVGPKARLGGVK